ncbi:HlyD family secretion protein [Novipirellula herctigrandis]|uniref:HlyD family secretion protein n=1 Tax=Novipirellula herctigrandis TaxID=2527986 RepID=UPI003AF35BC4
MLFLAALTAAYFVYQRWTNQPWTRDGQVRAHIVEVAPRVSGYIVEVVVKDNQFVSKGDLLFKIDPSDYQLAVDQAQVQLDQAREDVEALEAGLRAAEATIKQRNAAVTSAEGQIAQADAGIQSAEAVVTEAESGIESARAMIAEIEANLAEAQREAERAKRLAKSKAGSVETAEAKASAVDAVKAQLRSANAGLVQAQAAVNQAQAAEGEARARLVISQNGLAEAQAAVITVNADRDKAQANLGQPGDANVRVRTAKVQLEKAQLNLSWTSVFAPCDGYITNFDVDQGQFGSTGTPIAAFVDSGSFRVDGYFQESKLRHIHPGDRAIVTLMSHPDIKLRGVVDSIGYAVNPPGIANTEGSANLVPQVQPTFDWVRLPQRVPVRIRLEDVPESIQLVAGTTASVAIEPNRRNSK